MNLVMMNDRVFLVMCITSHLLGLKDTIHLCSHFYSRSMSCWRANVSASVLIFLDEAVISKEAAS